MPARAYGRTKGLVFAVFFPTIAMFYDGVAGCVGAQPYLH